MDAIQVGVIGCVATDTLKHSGVRMAGTLLPQTTRRKQHEDGRAPESGVVARAGLLSESLRPASARSLAAHATRLNRTTTHTGV